MLEYNFDLELKKKKKKKKKKIKTSFLVPIFWLCFQFGPQILITLFWSLYF